jgi:hypothetical protein
VVEVAVGAVGSIRIWNGLVSYHFILVRANEEVVSTTSNATTDKHDLEQMCSSSILANGSKISKPTKYYRRRTLSRSHYAD